MFHALRVRGLRGQSHADTLLWVASSSQAYRQADRAPMDSNMIAQVYDMISAYIPAPVQGLIVVVLALLGIQVGRNGSKQKGSSSAGSRTDSKASKSSKASFINSDAAPGHETSPGQTGPDATREMSSSEIRRLAFSYEPENDHQPDPGEVVWTWVPYVENDGRGKDRPVLLMARINNSSLAACYLSTKQHDGFVPMGSGSWDSKGRPSYLNPERVLRVSNSGVRREGARVSQNRFSAAVAAVKGYH